ncbi:Flp family type IVb pilin [Microvirga roseola]|uniref:Flp family type IVb pilin n=1 Tax=Microvirga roseola TaxID=2883126 RepID=UPI001E3D356F|nr:Flp family type IVb pilin [Microvirga roseola]
MKSLITRFARDESGATAIEYGLIAAGLAVVVIAIFQTAGPVDTLIKNLFAKVSTAAGV